MIFNSKQEDVCKRFIDYAITLWNQAYKCENTVVYYFVIALCTDR